MEELLQKSPQGVIEFIKGNERLCPWKGLKDGVEGLLGCTGLQLREERIRMGSRATSCTALEWSNSDMAMTSSQSQINSKASVQCAQ